VGRDDLGQIAAAERARNTPSSERGIQPRR
jgi:hypothetical protein